MIEFLIIILIICGVSSFLHFQDKEKSILFWIMIYSILGYRSFSILPGLRIHPLDILLLIYTIWVFLYNKKYKLPLGIQILGIYAIVWIFVYDLQTETWYFLEEFKGFIALIPVFILIGRILQRSVLPFHILATFIYACAFTSFLGILEYFYPSLTMSLPGFSVRDTSFENLSQLNTYEFFRAGFTFWGSPTVGHVLVLSIPFFWLNEIKLHIGNKFYVRVLWLLIVTGIYITGNRANWIQLLILGLFYFLFYSPIFHTLKNFVKAFSVLIILVILALNTLPQSTLQRFISGITAFQGNSEISDDSSGVKRFERYNEALQKIIENPFGNGWGSSGWVHADLLQLTANLGWLAGLIFLVSLLYPIIIGFKKLSKFPISSTYRKVLVVLVSLQTLIILNFWRNGIYNLPQTGVYYFIFWAMLYYFVKINHTKFNHESHVVNTHIQ